MLSISSFENLHSKTELLRPLASRKCHSMNSMKSDLISFKFKTNQSLYLHLYKATKMHAKYSCSNGGYSSQFYQLLAENLCENWISRQNALCATNISIPYPQPIDSPISQSALLLKRTFQSTFFIHYFQLIFLHTAKKKNALKNSDYLTPLPLLLVWWMAASNALLIYRKKPNFVLGLQFYHHIYFRTTH